LIHTLCRVPIKGKILFDWLTKKTAKPPVKRFPPVPEWQPQIVQPRKALIERLRFYTDDASDFVVFRHGSMAIVPGGLDDAQAATQALEALRQVYYAHPDMNPLSMQDGNILIQYSHDVLNIVLTEVVAANWAEIDARHMEALARDEVLMTPAGPNQFDDFGKKALFGRCYMFMDAQAPEVLEIVRQSHRA
jgi:hypothetical protein